MSESLLTVTPLFVQARGIEVSVSQAGVEPETRLVACKRIAQSPLVLQRNGAIEVKQRVVRTAADGLVVQHDRFAAALRFAE